MAKDEGKLFETDFKKSIGSHVFIQRLKDDTAGFKGVANICDYILYQYPNIYLLELKSLKGKSLPFSRIRDAQLKGLAKSDEIRGVIGGFIINFRDYEETYFISVVDMLHYIENSSRKSISLDYCRENGTKIGQHKIRTRYKYDVDNFLDSMGGFINSKAND